MDPLLLGAIVAVATILVLFSGVSVGLGLLIVSAGFLIVFDGLRSLELMPEILFGKLDNFALLSIPMFIIMGASIASTRAGADLYEALERWLTRSWWTGHFQSWRLCPFFSDVWFVSRNVCCHW